MSNLKKTILNKLHEGTVNEKTVTPDELRTNTDDLVKAAKDSLDIDDDQAKDYVSGFIGEISDLSDVNSALQSAREDWDMHLADKVEGSLKSFGLPDEVVVTILSKMQNAYWDGYDEVRRSRGGDWNDLDEVNQEVMDKFVDQYGKEKGEQIYYATANKQDRDPETFHTEDTGEDYGDIGMQDLEVGADKYEEYRQLMQQLADEEDGEQQIDEENDPVKLKADVEKLMGKLDMSAIAPYLEKIDNPTEQAEVIAQFAEKIGVPKQKLTAVVSQLKNVAESKRPSMTKNVLIETVTGKKPRKVIKTIKVKNIK